MICEPRNGACGDTNASRSSSYHSFLNQLACSFSISDQNMTAAISQAEDQVFIYFFLMLIRLVGMLNDKMPRFATTKC